MHVREPSCSTSNCDVVGGACPRSRFKTVYCAGRPLLSSRGRSRGFILSLLGSAWLDSRRAYMRVQRTCVHSRARSLRTCVRVCMRTPAVRSGTLPAHTRSLFVSRFFSATRLCSLHSLLFPLLAHASSHSRPGRSLSHSHPFTLDLEMRPIGCPKLFFPWRAPS